MPQDPARRRPGLDPHEPDQHRPTSRRSLVRGLAVGGLALPLLAACGGESSSSSASSGGPPQRSAAGPNGTGASGSGPAPDAQGGHALTTTAKVPQGGGEILPRAKVVVTQPVKGDYKCFSAVCTHAGCLVGTVQGGAIICPCHGSRFSVKDGSVLSGPATRPLPEYKITVQGNKITRA